MCKKNIFLTIVVFIGFIFWWFLFAFAYPTNDPAKYNYILGLPAWFFYSVVCGYIIFNIIAFIVVKYFFKD